MVKPRRNKVATEAFVLKLFNKLDKKIDDSVRILRTEMDIKFEEVEKRFTLLNEKFDKMMGHIVGLAGEFKKFAEEQTVLSERSKNHEDRIEKLEKTMFKVS